MSCDDNPIILVNSHMTDFLETLAAWLDEGVPVALATIASREGSAPRAAGSRMIVRPGGGMRGTVGGGLVEAKVLDAAAGAIETGETRIVDFDLTAELAAGADMICGGRLRVFVERIEAGPEGGLFRELLDRVRRGERCLMAVPEGGGPRSLLTAGNDLLGSPLPEALLESVRKAAEGLKAPVMMEAAGGRWLLVPWTGQPRLIIAGAGHVARFTARVAAMAGFVVTVTDDRPEFASRERFPEAREVLVRDPRVCLDGLHIGPDTSVVILTRGHMHDAEVLAQALSTGAGYIGMIGSRRKRGSVYAWLGERGFGGADFARVRCPVGLDIGAETPEEIAVSIVAELIKARAGR